MKRPNFFIFGAAKCGTTAMYEYLRGHPGVFFPAEKEPHHFCDDFPGFQRYKSPEAYASLFAPTTASQCIVGEASVFYLYSKVAARRIFEFNPGAKLVVMLRNPVDMIHSLHGHMVYARMEDVTDFERAWRLQEERATGRSLPAKTPEPAFLQYGRVGRLGEQVQRLLAIFPREQVLLVLFDDFCHSAQAAYEEVLEFLGLPSDSREDFPKVNEQKRHRLDALQNFLFYPPKPIAKVRDAVKHALGIRHTNIGVMLRRMNTVQQQRDPLNRELRVELVEYFRDDVALLADCLGRDLSHWSQPPATAVAR